MQQRRSARPRRSRGGDGAQILSHWDALHERGMFPYSLAGYREKFKLRHLRLRAYRAGSRWTLVFEQIGVSKITLEPRAQNWVAVIRETTREMPHWVFRTLGAPTQATAKHWLRDPLEDKDLKLPARGHELVLDVAGKKLLDHVGVRRPSELPFWQSLSSKLAGEARSATGTSAHPLTGDLRAAAKVRGNRPLTPADCTRIRELRVAAGDGSFDRTDVHDLSLLAGLKNLESLELLTPSVADLRPLSNLGKLRRLQILAMRKPSALRDLAPIAGLTKLEELVVYRAKVSDLSPLSGMRNLFRLAINAPVTSVPRGLVKLRYLELLGSSIRDLSFARGLRHLEVLECDSMQLRDLAPLRGLPALTSLSFAAKIKDLSPLLTLPRLSSLDVPRSLRGNKFLAELEARGVAISFGMLALSR